MKIRNYEPSDRARLIELHHELQVFEQVFRPSRAVGVETSERQLAEYESLLNEEDASLLVVDDSGTLIGYLMIVAESELIEEQQGQVYVQDFIVTAAARRKGVGTLMMSAVREFAALRGISRIDLQVLIGNAPAKAFYEALGFEIAYLGMKASVR